MTAQPRQKVLRETIAIVRPIVRVGEAGRIDGEADRMIGLEAGSNAAKSLEHHAACGRQHERDRNLAGDKKVHSAPHAAWDGRPRPAGERGRGDDSRQFRAGASGESSATAPTTAIANHRKLTSMPKSTHEGSVVAMSASD
jgi:hypothetical protein